MKIRVADRLLVCLAGLILIALCAGCVAQVCFGVPVIQTAESIFSGMNAASMIIAVVISVAVLCVGIYCVAMLFRHKKGRRGFVTQQSEIGNLDISLKAVQLLVEKCFDSHDEVKLENTNVEADKDVLIVNIKVTLLGGVSVPLAIGTLQKQIKQYVTDCTGVDVREVRVQVEMNGEATADTPYVVPQLAQGHVAARLKENTVSQQSAAPAVEQAEENEKQVEKETPAEAQKTSEEAPAADEAAAEEAEEIAEEPVMDEPATETEEAQSAAKETEQTEEKPEEPKKKGSIFSAFFADTKAAAEKKAAEAEESAE